MVLGSARTVRGRLRHLVFFPFVFFCLVVFLPFIYPLLPLFVFAAFAIAAAGARFARTVSIAAALVLVIFPILILLGCVGYKV